MDVTAGDFVSVNGLVNFAESGNGADIIRLGTREINLPSSTTFDGTWGYVEMTGISEATAFGLGIIPVSGTSSYDTDAGEVRYSVTFTQNGGTPVASSFNLYNTATNTAFAYSRLVLSDEQWDLASGEAYYFGYDANWAAVNGYSQTFWDNRDHPSVDLAFDHANWSSTTEAEIFPDEFHVGEVGGVSVLSNRELTGIQIISQNLAQAVLGSNPKYDSGYVFDENYHSLTDDRFHAGMDIGVPGWSEVYSPVDGHIIRYVDTPRERSILAPSEMRAAVLHVNAKRRQRPRSHVHIKR